MSKVLLESIDCSSDRLFVEADRPVITDVKKNSEDER